jgi:hypothetical protein
MNGDLAEDKKPLPDPPLKEREINLTLKGKSQSKAVVPGWVFLFERKIRSM